MEYCYIRKLFYVGEYKSSEWKNKGTFSSQIINLKTSKVEHFIKDRNDKNGIYYCWELIWTSILKEKGQVGTNYILVVPHRKNNNPNYINKLVSEKGQKTIDVKFSGKTTDTFSSENIQIDFKNIEATNQTFFIIDDVYTSGKTINFFENKILENYPNANIKKYAFALTNSNELN